MRIQVELTSKDTNENIILPLHYNKVLQGLIYNSIRINFPNLHDYGYPSAGRKIKLFVFSRLIGKVVTIRENHIIFNGPVAFKVASPDSSFIETLANNLLHMPVINLAGMGMLLRTVSIQPQADFSSGLVRFKAISPVTVYSTLVTPDGRKKTYYYHPAEKEFSQQIKANLGRKGELLGLERDILQNINVNKVMVRNSDQKIVYFKDTIIKGWMGIYELKGDPRMLSIAWDCGIGAKNSQGFGMLECI